MPTWTRDMPLVVCLCAQWCNVCEQYRSIFRQVQTCVQVDHTNIRFVWLDIEDEADTLDPLDVENFPTVLLSIGGEPRFFGPITPQAQTLERLVRMALQDPVGTPLADPQVRALVGRIQTRLNNAADASA
jgi:thioredoxin 1